MTWTPQFLQQFQIKSWWIHDRNQFNPAASSLTASASGNPLVSSGFPVSQSNMLISKSIKNSIHTALRFFKINPTNTHQGHLTPLPNLHHHSAHPWNKTVLRLQILFTDVNTFLKLQLYKLWELVFKFPSGLVFTSNGVEIRVGIVIRNTEQYDVVKIKSTELEAEFWLRLWCSTN